jgi:hypothetical protein
VSSRQERRRAERDSKKSGNKQEHQIKLSSMIEISDNVIVNKESINHGKYLAGQIDTELRIPHEMLVDAGIMGFFHEVCVHYIKTAKSQQYPQSIDLVHAEKYFVQMLTMWVVSQQPNEYNPIHIHTECQLSCVMYLKVPKFEPSKKSHRNNDDGSITFISNASTDNEFTSPTLQLRPSAGDFFIFSAKQLHTVYPYRCTKGDPERRSVSFNAIFETETMRKNRSKEKQNVLSHPVQPN